VRNAAVDRITVFTRSSSVALRQLLRVHVLVARFSGFSDLFDRARMTPCFSAGTPADEQCVPRETAKSYQTTPTGTASPAERRLMLLEGSVTWTRSLASMIDADDSEGIAESSERCRAILIALGTDLDTRVHSEMASRLSSLHTWLYQCVTEVTRSDELDEVIELLEFQRDAWREAVEVLRSGGTATSSDVIDMAS
jgi:flagellar biosynthetic protein FliS